MTFTVLSWNVLADAWTHPALLPDVDPSLLRPGVRDRRVVDVLLEAVDTAAVDVIGLQEVQKPVAGRLRRALGSGWAVSFHAPRGEDVGTFLAARTHLNLRSTMPAGRAIAGRRIHTGIVTVHGLDIRVMVVHMPGCDLTRADLAHPAVPLAQVALALASDGRPAVLAADTNDLPGGQVRSVLADGGFIDAGRPGPTSRFLGIETRDLDIVVARGLVPVATYTLASPGDGPLPSPAMPSDHVPIISTFDLPS